MFLNPHCRKCRVGFTLVEALVSTSIMAMAGSALLLGVQTAIVNSDDARDRTIAAGMARQLMDEAMGKIYVVPGGDPYQTPLCPNAYELAGAGRERFNDIDDYHEFTAQPAKDMYGKNLGTGNGIGGTRHTNFQMSNTYFRRWKQKIDVYYVNENNPSVRLNGNSTSNYRAVEVTITQGEPNGKQIELARLRRVHAYVPSYP